MSYIGSKNKDKAETATEQPFLVILSTAKENQYPQYIKLCSVPADNQKYNENFISKRAVLSKKENSIQMERQDNTSIRKNHIRSRKSQIKISKYHSRKYQKQYNRDILWYV